MKAKRPGAGVVLESFRNNKLVYLCANCPMPRTKTDDPEVPVLKLIGDAWFCPKCDFSITVQEMDGEDEEIS